MKLHDFKNGDKVKYCYGLTFIFIGDNPNNENEAYCIHPTAVDKNSDFNINNNIKRIDSLLIEKLTLVSNEI